MKNIYLPLILSAVSLVGCSATSGPTFSARELQARDGVRTYQVDCHGLFSSSKMCMRVATRVCGDQPVHVIDSAQPLRNAPDPDSLTFQCRAKDVAQSTPVPAPVVMPIPQHITLSTDANFDFDQATLTPTAHDRLNKLIADATGLKFGTVEVNGYTDGVGPNAYNLHLSELRAQAVAGYLQSHGLEATGFDVKGYGKDNPVATNSTAEGRAKNRRVEITLPQQ
ncbi:OmpA family protein [Burkholderia thailandensis]|uniref:OmpA family protein n=1 Tax=Burkholderia thailandensis TaxID=57975 RepID=UPI000C99BA84|nr:OmpA family protein [Burkholderia thailandensis]PNE76454.1 OmpA family protein [Burkholderia thailandensis]